MVIYKLGQPLCNSWQRLTLSLALSSDPGLSLWVAQIQRCQRQHFSGFITNIIWQWGAQGCMAQAFKYMIWHSFCLVKISILFFQAKKVKISGHVFLGWDHFQFHKCKAHSLLFLAFDLHAFNFTGTKITLIMYILQCSWLEKLYFNHNSSAYAII